MNTDVRRTGSARYELPEAFLRRPAACSAPRRASGHRKECLPSGCRRIEAVSIVFEPGDGVPQVGRSVSAGCSVMPRSRRPISSAEQDAVVALANNLQHPAAESAACPGRHSKAGLSSLSCPRRPGPWGSRAAGTPPPVSRFRSPPRSSPPSSAQDEPLVASSCALGRTDIINVAPFDIPGIDYERVAFPATCGASHSRLPRSSMTVSSSKLARE